MSMFERVTGTTLLPINTGGNMALCKRVLAAAAAIATGGVLALAPTPASASVSQGYVIGVGAATDDWGDEGPLSASQHSKSYAVGLWQWVLWAEGVKEPNGTQFDMGDIDCRFGSTTTYATKQLQARWHLSQDGIVGKDTFSRADNELVLFAGGAIDDVTYGGNDGEIGFWRDELGQYNFPVVYEDNEYLTASYANAPAEACQYGS
ncbi:hypothetical protein QFZ22_009565 [Streptomyces canus]|uniref:Peptidoglycan binding-like domain-containing protein n=1 Tax=Streptomyces canus TaxID=58343 RepID=A0AAW8FXT3_9ACTN|nr:hypothetical protein [Streptomyces canus]MDQ0913493.1 hypothetical protein [Streptomyces canus]